MKWFSAVLFALLMTVSSAAQAQYFEHDPDDKEQNAPLREGEKAVIPLDKTVLNSERIVREALVGMAMRKKGIGDKWYLDERTVDDARK